jgi:ureidoacrylate peracid hydrolase
MNLKGPAKDAWVITPDTTALVVIDMQRAFVDTGLCIGAKELVPKINELAATCRKLSIPVTFVKASRRADLSDSGLMADMRILQPDNEMRALEGKKGVEFCDDLNVTQDDYIVPKKRYSALIPGSSVLEPLLHGLGRDSFIICGVATDICVGTTTTDGMMLGFKVFLVGDLTATFSEERHKAALEVYDSFAKVMTFDAVMKELAQLVQQVP